MQFGYFESGLSEEKVSHPCLLTFCDPRHWGVQSDWYQLFTSTSLALSAPTFTASPSFFFWYWLNHESEGGRRARCGDLRAADGFSMVGVVGRKWLGVKAEGHLEVFDLPCSKKPQIFLSLTTPHPLTQGRWNSTHNSKQLSKYLPITRAEMMIMSRSLAPPPRSLFNWTNSPKSAYAIRCLPCSISLCVSVWVCVSVCAGARACELCNYAAVGSDAPVCRQLIASPSSQGDSGWFTWRYERRGRSVAPFHL